MTDNRIIYLYSITNTINGKIYIGQTIDPNSRWRAHRRYSASDNPKQAIHLAIKKYGNDVFEFEVIAASSNREDADWVEEYLIGQYNSRYPTGYNIEMGGIRRPEMSQITKDKITELAKQRYQNDPVYRKHFQNIRADYHKYLEENNLPLPIHTVEIKKKSLAAFQAARDGYYQQYGVHWWYEASQDPEVRKKRSQSLRKTIQQRGQHWSKGRVLSPEHKDVFKRSGPLSPEHKVALAEGSMATRFQKGNIPVNLKLTKEIAIQMKIKHEQGISIRALSREFGINSKSIANVLKQMVKDKE